MKANLEIGSSLNPYEIASPDDLKAFRDRVNNGQTTISAKLTKDIDLNPEMKVDENGTVTGATNWVPIGTDEHPYIGSFDGQNRTISGLYIDNTTVSYTGLFGVVGAADAEIGTKQGIVQNLAVDGYINAGTFVGGVVGQNSGNVTNCSHSGAVSGDNNGSKVGGIVGRNYGGAVKNCSNSGKVTGFTVGGVVGSNEYSNAGGSSVKDCYNIGDVAGDIAGGIVGINGNQCSVMDCYNIGDITGGEIDNDTVGGIVGMNSSGDTVKNCYFEHKDGAPDKGIGGGQGTANNVESKSADDFHSGEVAHLLGDAWGQSNLDATGSWPTLKALDDSAQPVYKVTFKDSEVPETNPTVEDFTNSTVAFPEFTREGYTLSGWKDDGGTTHKSGNTVTISKDTTFIAQWEEIGTEPEPEPEPDPDPEPDPENPSTDPDDPEEDDPSDNPFTPSGPSTPSGPNTYPPTVEDSDHGSVEIDNDEPEAGDTVTITPKPDEGYEVEDVIVTDEDGNRVAITENPDGSWSYEQPDCDVTIEVIFGEIEPEPTTDVSEIFVDVAPNAWYKDAVQYAYDNGLMTGVSANEFAPEQTTTRAMIVSILARLENVTSAESAGFADVSGEWFATAVNWAASVGVVNGFEDNTFRPNDPITREQLAAILMNYSAWKGEDVSARDDLTIYIDQPSAWARETMQWAVAEGLISGVTNDELQPQGNATRAQVAAILQRYLAK